MIPMRGPEDARPVPGMRRQVVEEVVDLVNNPRTSVSMLSATLVRDRALTRLVLRRANSSYYGFSGRVNSVHFAISLLGFDALKETLSHWIHCAALRKMVNGFVRYEEQWNHGLTCGLIAYRLAGMMNGIDAESAFAAGLVHDAGHFVPKTNDQLWERIRRVRSSVLSIVEPTGHEEIGGRIAREWGLAPESVEAVRYHHLPTLAVLSPALSALIHVADELATRIMPADQEPVRRFNPSVVSLLAERGLAVLTPEDMVRAVVEPYAAGRSWAEYLAQVKGHLITSVERLSHPERMIMALMLSEGMEPVNIATLLGTSEHQVKQQFAGAFRQLRFAVDEYGGLPVGGHA